MASIYDSSPNKVIEAIELLDNELWQQSLKLNGSTYKWRLDNGKLANLQRPTGITLHHLKVYANDYHSAKSMAQFSDASELHEPYVQLLDQWIEQTAIHYELTQDVLKAKINVMLGRIAQYDQKIQHIRIGLGAACVACSVWMGFNIYENVGVSRQREIIDVELAQVNTTYNQVYSEALKTFPPKKSRGLLGFAKSVVGYQDPPPEQLSQVEIPQNPAPEQKELLNKLKVVKQQKKQYDEKSNHLSYKQSGIILWIIFSSIMLIFIPMYGWMWIPANRYKSKKIN
jgi:hypothetical protein